MDEVLFRSSEKLESLSHQLGVVTNESKYFIQQHGIQAKNQLVRLIQASKLDEIQESVKKLVATLVTIVKEAKRTLVVYFSPYNVYQNLVYYFSKRWTKGEIIIGCAGLVVGGIIGFCYGYTLNNRSNPVHYMQAIQCLNYDGIEAVNVVEDAVAPSECGDKDVIINVKAASVQVIDAKICEGYGKSIRKFMSRFFKHVQNDLPTTLGRDCTGIVVDIGTNVHDLEIGDEVWLASPFWAPGTLSRTVTAPACLVGKKPPHLGFEASCSLPSSFGIVLDVLKNANITESNATKKKIFIHGTCTPVGCIMAQILISWKCHVSGSCYERAEPVAKALGVKNTIAINDNDHENFQKQLVLLDTFDYVFVTQETDFNFAEYCSNNGVFSTYHKQLFSDHFGMFSYSFFSLYMFFKHCVFGACPNYGAFSLVCRNKLDILAKLTTEGKIQTVVDKVALPQEIELILHHVRSSASIGSAIVTFR